MHAIDPRALLFTSESRFRRASFRQVTEASVIAVMDPDGRIIVRKDHRGVTPRAVSPQQWKELVECER